MWNGDNEKNCFHRKNEAVDALKSRGYMKYAVQVTKEETSFTLIRA
jgi:cell division septation protein DedD